MNARLDSIQAKIAEILENHFQNHENPHETIYRIWALLNVDAEASIETFAHAQTRH